MKCSVGPAPVIDSMKRVTVCRRSSTRAARQRFWNVSLARKSFQF